MHVHACVRMRKARYMGEPAVHQVVEAVRSMLPDSYLKALGSCDRLACVFVPVCANSISPQAKGEKKEGVRAICSPGDTTPGPLVNQLTYPKRW